MAVNETKTTNLTYTKTELTIDPYQTTDATPTIVQSFPVKQNQGVRVRINAVAISSTYAAIASQIDFVSTFVRSTGNLARTSVSDTSGTQGGIQGNFASPQPSISIVANTTTQSIDIGVVGKAATTINWNIEIELNATN